MISSIPTPIPTFTLPYRATTTTAGSPLLISAPISEITEPRSFKDPVQETADLRVRAASMMPAALHLHAPRNCRHTTYLPDRHADCGATFFPTPFFFSAPPFRFQRVRFGRGSIAWRLASSLFLAGDTGVGVERRTCILHNTTGDIARQEATAPVLL